MFLIKNSCYSGFMKLFWGGKFTMIVYCNLQALHQRSLSDSLLLEDDNVSGKRSEYTDLHFLEGTDMTV